jgi:CheY-like chemotaxis protein
MRSDPVTFNLEEIIFKKTKNYALQAAQKDIRLFCCLDPAIDIHVFGDVNIFSQVLDNLLDNAVKFTLQGSIIVNFFQAATNDKHRVILHGRITDTGIGIPLEYCDSDLDHMITPKPPIEDIEESTGLGINIVKMYLNIIGGAIEFNPLAVGGTQVEFTVPLIKVSLTVQALDISAPAPAIPKEPQSIERVSVNTKDRRLLIAEDNPVNLIILKKNIEQLGYSYSAFEDGKSALNELIINHDQYFAVIMDCEMPILDGFIATQRLREWEVLNAKVRLPVIALTAHQTEDVKSKASAHGMEEVLTKPVDKETLKKSIANLQ